MNLIFSSIGNFNWPGLLSLVVFFFAGYVTRVVIEQIKPIWATQKELRKIQKVSLRFMMPNPAQRGIHRQTSAQK